MRFIDHYRGEIERGRGRVIAPLILRDWSTYRGKAIEPLVRDAVDELLPDGRFGDAAAVGAFWADGDGNNGRKSIEVDLVGADRRDSPATRLAFIGSIKWREKRKMLKRDYSALIAAGSEIHGVDPAEIRTVAVSRVGVDPEAAEAFDLSLDADDILRAWTVR